MNHQSQQKLFYNAFLFHIMKTNIRQRRGTEWARDLIIYIYIERERE